MKNPNRWEWNKVGAPITPSHAVSPARILAELLIPLAVAGFFYWRGKIIAAAVVAAHRMIFVIDCPGSLACGGCLPVAAL